MNRTVGIILVAASAAGFGTLAIFGRYVHADGMDALTILCLRFALAAIRRWPCLLFGASGYRAAQCCFG